MSIIPYKADCLPCISSIASESLLRRLDRPVNLENSLSNSLKIDRDKFMIELNNEKIILPKKEFELLELLASRPGKVYNREQILSIVWGNETNSSAGEKSEPQRHLSQP